MTVDSELRAIWRKDLKRLEEKLDQLQRFITTLDLEIAVHHPRLGLPPPAAERQAKMIEGGQLGDD